MRGAALGVADHAGWAILVAATSNGLLLDRRRIELVDEGLPKMPQHHDAQALPIEEGVALVERVRSSAEEHARRELDAVAATVPVLTIALRALQPLPPTVAERITNYRARNVADWVMYRTALAAAAEARGWGVHWYDSKSVIGAASRALRVANLDAHFREAQRALGPPWTNDHKLALAAAIVAARAP